MTFFRATLIGLATLDDAVYSLSLLKLEVHALDDLATPLATVPLP